MIDSPIAVCSRTFSKHPELRALIQKSFSNIKFNDAGQSLAGEELSTFLHDRVGAVVALEPLTDEVLAGLPEFKYVAKYGVGLDGLDQEALRKHGVALGWTGGVNRRSVSELALGMVLSMIRNIDIHTVALRQGTWKNTHGHQLTGKTVGIVGCGHIGKDLVHLLKAFSCRILVNDILDLSEFAEAEKVEVVSKERLFAEADVVSLHVPYTSETHHLVNSQTLASMKSSALLVNTSRGNVVDENALAEALKSGKIYAAALDVFAREPDVPQQLLDHPNFLATPHNGGSSAEGIMAMGQAAVDNLYKIMRADMK